MNEPDMSLARHPADEGSRVTAKPQSATGGTCSSCSRRFWRGGHVEVSAAGSSWTRRG